MKRLMTTIAAGILALAMAGSAAAAPRPTDPLGNHPVFPLVCSGGEFDVPTFGWSVIVNGGSNATLPTAFFYPGGDETGPDLTADPILGVSMYRQIIDVTDIPVIVDEGGRGNQTMEHVVDRWDVSTCVTPPLPGEALAAAYPDGGYQVGHFYQFLNLVK